MRRRLARIFLFSCLVGSPCLGVRIGLAQDTEALVDRILNPLPDYDPFDKPPPSPRFFPDDVDKRARAALIDALTNKEENLEGHLRFFMERDAQLKKERGAVTGLTEQVRDLTNGAIRDRERYLEAQEKALSSASSPQQKQLIESRIKNDELNQADDLLKKSAINRWGGMLNRLLSSVDLAAVLSGSYVGAAVDTTMSQLLALGSSEMPIEERRALALLYEHLRRYPDEPKNAEVRKQIEALEKKKRRALVQQQIDKAEEAIDKKEPGKARFHYAAAVFIDPLSRDVEAGQERLRKRLQEEEQAQKKALAVVAPPSAQGAKTDDAELKGLLYALALRDPQRIEAQAKTLEQQHQGKPLAALARDARAVALEIKGEHEEAKTLLRQVARASNAPHEKTRAQALLDSPEYNMLASFQQARTQHRLETAKYVLLGEDFLRKNLLVSTSSLITAGPVGATSVAAANAIMIGSNLFQVLTNNPISYQSVIDRGVEYVRDHPQSRSATEVYSVLADAYEDAGMYDKAIAYHEMSGKASEKKIADLKEKTAQSLLEAATKSTERDAQEFYLKAILDHYPESAAAKEATLKLSRMTKIENQGLRMSKQFLLENPELYGPQGLRLKPSLFDGNLSNLELADRGISIIGEREILLHLQTPWGVRSQVYPIDKESTDRFQMSLRKKNYDVAMADVDSRTKGSQGGIRNLPRSVVTGELGKKAADSERGDSTFTLVREAGGSSTAYPKVLDQQLLTESERDPTTRFKLPPIQGSISASGFDISGALPGGLWGDRLMIGNDSKSPFAGVQLPIPLLQGFIPVDFMLQGRPGRFSLFPKLHLYKDKGDDQELYR